MLFFKCQESEEQIGLFESPRSLLANPPVLYSGR